MIQEKMLKIHNLMEDEINIELSGFMEQAGILDILEVMQGDTDMLNIGGNRIHFVELDTDKNKWVVYLNPEPAIERERIESILLSFFSEEWEENFELKGHGREEFKHNCIAYRGSQSAFYEIWKYRKDKNEMIAAGKRLFSIGDISKIQAVEVRNLKRTRSEERRSVQTIPDSLNQLPGKAGKSFFTVSQGQAPRGFEKNHPHYVPVFFPKNLDTPEGFTLCCPTVG